MLTQPRTPFLPLIWKNCFISTLAWCIMCVPFYTHNSPTKGGLVIFFWHLYSKAKREYYKEHLYNHYLDLIINLLLYFITFLHPSNYHMCVFQSKMKISVHSPLNMSAGISFTAQYLFTVFFLWCKIDTNNEMHSLKKKHVQFSPPFYWIFLLISWLVNVSSLFSSIWTPETYNPWTENVWMHLPFNFMPEWQWVGLNLLSLSLLPGGFWGHCSPDILL